MNGSRSEIAFANCNSLEACQNALSEDFIPKTSVLWGKIKNTQHCLPKMTIFFTEKLLKHHNPFGV